MEQATERVAFPFTFLLKREGDQWASLACEVDVASCGDTQEEALEGLKEAVELYVVSMLEEGRLSEIERRVPADALAEFFGDHPEEVIVEHRTLVVALVPPSQAAESSGEFLRSVVTQVDCTSYVGAAH